MGDVFVSLWAQSDVGMQRAGNEDSFLVVDLTARTAGLDSKTTTHKIGERGSLLVVSDGMGGAAAGEIASEMAVTTLQQLLESDSTEGDVAERLRHATEAANERIWYHAQSNPEMTGMGATVTAALVLGDSAHIAQVGDSRAYLIRGPQIKQITKDQSLAQMLIEFGAIKPDQVNSVPQNVIMQALGTQPEVKVAMTTVRLSADDCLLICSDGLSNKVSQDELRTCLETCEDLDQACRKMIQTANERGGEDNITVVVARFSGEGLGENARSITGSLQHISPDFFAQKLVEVAIASGAEPADAEPEVAPSVEPEAAAEEESDDDPEEVTLRMASPARPIVEPQEEGDEVSSDAPTESLAGKAEQEEAPERTSLPRKSYALIWVIALISLLLVLATAYFFYNLYLKPKPVPVDPATTPSVALVR
jgi:serine/threonine protein phosphatase PrpC